MKSDNGKLSKNMLDSPSRSSSIDSNLGLGVDEEKERAAEVELLKQSLMEVAAKAVEGGGAVMVSAEEPVSSRIASEKKDVGAPLAAPTPAPEKSKEQRIKDILASLIISKTEREVEGEAASTGPAGAAAKEHEGGPAATKAKADAGGGAAAPVPVVAEADAKAGGGVKGKGKGKGKSNFGRLAIGVKNMLGAATKAGAGEAAGDGGGGGKGAKEKQIQSERDWEAE